MRWLRYRGWSLEVRLLLLAGFVFVPVLAASAWISAISAVGVVEKEISARSREEADRLAVDLEAATPDLLPEDFRSRMSELIELVPGITRVDVFAEIGGAVRPVGTSSSSGFRNPSEEEKGLFLAEKVDSFERSTDLNRQLLTVRPLFYGDGRRGFVTVVNSLSAVDRIFAVHAEVGLYSMLVSILGLLAAISLVFRRTVYVDILHLVAVMKRFREGDSSARASDFVSREFRIISRHLNYMLGKIQRLTEEMQQEIATATESLQLRNRELESLNLHLAESRRSLSQSRRLALVGQLTASFAHEVGSPLGAVSTHLQLLLEERSLPSEVLDRLQLAYNEIERVSSVVEGLLDTTRSKPEWEPICLDDLVGEVAALLGPVMNSRGIRFEFENPGEPALVNGNRDQLEEVFLNLFNNALDAIDTSGSLSVRISGPPENDSNMLRVDVCDTGAGIPPEELSSIFRPFFSNKKTNKGTGLGLALTREVLHLHGGKISVKSRLGHGTCFEILLPKVARDTVIADDRKGGTEN